MSSESRFTKPPGSTSLAKAKREEDLKMLNALLSAIEGVREEDREAFLGMRKALVGARKVRSGGFGRNYTAGA